MWVVHLYYIPFPLSFYDLAMLQVFPTKNSVLGWLDILLFPYLSFTWYLWLVLQLPPFPFLLRMGGFLHNISQDMNVCLLPGNHNGGDDGVGCRW